MKIVRYIWKRFAGYDWIWTARALTAAIASTDGDSATRAAAAGTQCATKVAIASRIAIAGYSADSACRASWKSVAGILTLGISGRSTLAGRAGGGIYAITSVINTWVTAVAAPGADATLALTVNTGPSPRARACNRSSGTKPAIARTCTACQTRVLAVVPLCGIRLTVCTVAVRARTACRCCSGRIGISAAMPAGL